MRQTNGKFKVSICIILTVAGLLQAAEPNEPSLSFRWLKLELGYSPDKDRINALGKALDFENWPESNVFRVAPYVGKSLLSKPELVTNECITYDCVQFGQEMWGEGQWSWRRVVDSNEPLPTQLPENRMNIILQTTPLTIKNDPNRFAEYLKKQLKKYQDTKRKRVEGNLSVEIVVAPNSRAAYEYVLYRMISNQMPTDIMVGTYSMHMHKGKIPRFGTMDTPGGFIRDNVVVRVEADGQFLTEALPLVQKIDAALKQQSPLTYQQLISRRPTVTINPNVEKDKAGWAKSISFDASAPSGRSIGAFSCTCMAGDKPCGCFVHRDSKRIVLPGKKGPLNVKLTAITNELLANTAERDVIVTNN